MKRVKFNINTVFFIGALLLCLYNAVVALDGAQAIAWVAVALVFQSNRQRDHDQENLHEYFEGLTDAIGKTFAKKRDTQKAFNKVAKYMEELNDKAVSGLQQERDEDKSES